jgi:hypothetical protein
MTTLESLAMTVDDPAARYAILRETLLNAAASSSAIKKEEETENVASPPKWPPPPPTDMPGFVPMGQYGKKRKRPTNAAIALVTNSVIAAGLSSTELSLKTGIRERRLRSEAKKFSKDGRELLQVAIQTASEQRQHAGTVSAATTEVMRTGTALIHSAKCTDLKTEVVRIIASMRPKEYILSTVAAYVCEQVQKLSLCATTRPSTLAPCIVLLTSRAHVDSSQRLSAEDLKHECTSANPTSTWSSVYGELFQHRWILFPIVTREVLSRIREHFDADTDARIFDAAVKRSHHFGPVSSVKFTLDSISSISPSV